jgi:hypothetical protein
MATDRISNYGQYIATMTADVKAERVTRDNAPVYCQEIAARCDWFGSRPTSDVEVWLALEGILISHEDDTMPHRFRIIEDDGLFLVQNGWQHRYSDQRYIPTGADLNETHWKTRAVRSSHAAAEQWLRDNYDVSRYVLEA